MIKVKIKESNNVISSIKITGHAMYDTIGKDIVCSAVSSITITTINAILSINENAIKYTKNSDGLVIDIISHDEITNKLILNMIELLLELEKDYKDNIKIMRGDFL